MSIFIINRAAGKNNISSKQKKPILVKTNISKLEIEKTKKTKLKDTNQKNKDRHYNLLGKQ